jgi:hypothetical protein
MQPTLFPGACTNSHGRQALRMPVLLQEVLALGVLLVTHDLEEVPEQGQGLGHRLAATNLFRYYPFPQTSG